MVFAIVFAGSGGNGFSRIAGGSLTRLTQTQTGSGWEKAFEKPPPRRGDNRRTRVTARTGGGEGDSPRRKPMV